MGWKEVNMGEEIKLAKLLARRYDKDKRRLSGYLVVFGVSVRFPSSNSRYHTFIAFAG